MAMELSVSPVHQEPQPGSKQFRNHLAAAVRSINWSYGIFWSVSSTRPAGVLTWRDGFYNGETKTRKVITSTSSRLTADQLALQRSEQLRELYESLQPPAGERDGDRRRPRRPVAALSPEDLGDTEWFYVVCMTYAFRPGQGLPGKSLARNEHVWLSNAHLADSKTFPRALIAKSASIQTIVCIPLMDGVLELGATDSILEDPADLVTRATTPFRDLPACTEEPTSSPSSDATRFEPSEHTIAFEDIDDHHTTSTEPTTIFEGHDLDKLFVTEHPPDPANNFDEVAMEIDELYNLCNELEDVQQPLEDDWILTMDGVLDLPPSSPNERAVPELAGQAFITHGHGSHFTSFKPWTRSDADDVAGVTTTGMEPTHQKLLKKVVAGVGAWTNNNGTMTSTTRTTTMTQESGVIKNHVMSERRRREKLNEMFVVLKSLIPSTRKVDKASILAETIAYLKELEGRVHELESRNNELVEVVGANKKVYVGGAKRKKKKGPDELDAGDHRRRKEEEEEKRWVRLPSNVSITVEEREVILDVECRWKERLMTRVFDVVKSLHLNILSVQSSTLDGIMGLKVRAQFATSASVAPGMITEALQEAISSKH